ncbi:unnamed protein product [Ectocarpus sp. CCAP 1310/34]|nr:unnamed protein product [Ectocarpus sp. CCAP 1310/34]
MPCAEGELCLQQDRTPQPPHGHPCKGGCGGRLHGNCGSGFEDNEQHRICTTCVARTSKRKATPAKGAGAGPSKRQKQTSGGCKKGTGFRARLDNNKKLEILKMLDQKVSHAQIADRFKCLLRFIGTVKAGRQKVETATAAGCSSQKTARKGDFPEVDEIALDLLDKARKAKMPVTRDVLRSFGRSTRATLLADTATSAAVRERVEDFKAGKRWAKNFVKRNKIQSVRLHGEAGSVDKEAIKEGMEEIRALCEKYPARFIVNVDESGLQWKLMPRRTYLSTSEDRKTARGSKSMNFKDGLSAIMCCNADGTAKVYMAIMGRAKEPRCFKNGGSPLKYFSQTNAWSDSATFLKCDLVDDRGQVTVKTYPPLCTAVHQPMDLGVIAKTKVNYRKELLDVKTSTMLVADTLRAQAKARKMIVGTMGLAQGHQPHVRDAAELLQKAWASVTAQDIARCFVKAESLPEEMAAELTKQHGKTRFNVAEPDLKALAETVNTLSTSVQDAQKQGSRVVDEEISELLAELNIEPGKPVAGEAVAAIQRWATIEDDEEVVEALRLDAVEDMTALLAGTNLSTGGDDEEDEQDQGGGGENTGRERRAPRAPPGYEELSSHFGALEVAAEDSGNGDAAFYLTKAKMSMIAAHSARRVRQTDIRGFV